MCDNCYVKHLATAEMNLMHRFIQYIIHNGLGFCIVCAHAHTQWVPWNLMFAVK
jgi:hypothetical protein